MLWKVIKGEHPINKHPICYKCPYKVYRDVDETISYGIGNIYSDIMLIGDGIINQTSLRGGNGYLQYIKEIYEKVSNFELENNVYITDLIKCNDKSEYIDKNDCLVCIEILKSTIAKHKYRKIIFTGNTLNIAYKYDPLFIKKLIKLTKVYKTYSIKCISYNNPKVIDDLTNQLSSILC